MEKDLISVVIPIYNVEKYLRECLDSVIKQTYKNLEIILIDDGSPDNCGKICDEYSEIDDRIVVIHKKNGGISDARNAGLDIVKGKYIAFVDSDDYIDSDYIEQLYNALIKNNVSISQCGIEKVKENKEKIEDIGYKEECVKDAIQMIKDLHDTEWHNTVVWNKLYSKELFNNLRFPKGKIHEDEYITYQVIYNAKEVAIIDKFLYKYRQNAQSITGRKFYMERLDILDAIEERIQFFKDKNEEDLYILSLEIYLQKIRENYINIRKYIGKGKEKEKELMQKHRKYFKYLLKSKKIKVKSKIKMMIFGVSPKLFYKIKQYQERI